LSFDRRDGRQPLPDDLLEKLTRLIGGFARNAARFAPKDADKARGDFGIELRLTFKRSLELDN
jgi:hypothetical protein